MILAEESSMLDFQIGEIEDRNSKRDRNSKWTSTQEKSGHAASYLLNTISFNSYQWYELHFGVEFLLTEM